MKRFKKLPVILGIVLSVMLVFGGVAFATGGFNFATVDADVTVIECVTLQMNGDGIAYIPDGWNDIPASGAVVTMANAKPGEYVDVPVKADNDSYEDLNVRMEYVTSSEDVIITSDWIAGAAVLGNRNGGADTTNTIRVEIDGDAVPGDYTVTFYFYRY